MRRKVGRVKKMMRAAMVEEEGKRRGGSSVGALGDFITTAISQTN